VHSEVGVTLNTLRRLQLLAGTDVLVTSHSSGVSRLARAVALDAAASPDARDGVAYLPPVLAFNLQLALHLRPFLGAARPTVSLVPLASVAAVRAARVSLVREPADPAEVLVGVQPVDSTDELDAALHRHFRTPRLLAQGDVFAVFCAPEVAGLHGAADRPRLVHFRVASAEPQSGKLDRDTRLVLDGSTIAAAPPAASLHAFAAPAAVGVPPRALDVAHPAAALVCSLAAPLLHPSAATLRLRLAILLKGPAGVGKRSVVAAAAAALGMRLVTYNCHELAPSGGGCARRAAGLCMQARLCGLTWRTARDRSDGKTASAIAGSFKAAAGYAPSVLLLRRFGALTSGAPGGAPDAGAAGAKVAPLLSRTLEHCIRLHGHANAAADAGAAAASSDDDEEEGSEGDSGEEEAPEAAAAEQAGEGGEGHARTWRRSKRRAPGKGAVLLLAAVENADALPPDVRRCFTHEVEVLPPDEGARAALLREALGCAAAALDVTAAAAATAGLLPRDLRAIAADAAVAAAARLSDDADADASATPLVLQRDLDDALRRAGTRTSAAIGAPKVPEVTWDDVGGLEEAKRAILDTVQLPLRHRALFSKGGRRRSGALLYGPPGTGKTLLAKAVATECGLRFLAVKGPELINMYVGESERNVREVFARARAARPCIVFFDELDALAPARGSGGDSGGVMDRVVSQLLAEVDGLSGTGGEDVFVIGATNRPDLLDPALLRPGRFDKMLYIGVDDSLNGRLRVLEALTRRFQLAPDVQLSELARVCPQRYTGADLYALCADAWMRAVKRRLALGDAAAAAAAVIVDAADFTESMAELAPSLSSAELERYAALAAGFDARDA
jgi:peroxin-6